MSSGRILVLDNLERMKYEAMVLGTHFPSLVDATDSLPTARAYLREGSYDVTIVDPLSFARDRQEAVDLVRECKQRSKVILAESGIPDDIFTLGRDYDLRHGKPYDINRLIAQVQELRG